jgi:hypothetical protein
MSEDNAGQARLRSIELKREKTEKSLGVGGFSELHGIQSTGTEQLAE